MCKLVARLSKKISHLGVRDNESPPSLRPYLPSYMVPGGKGSRGSGDYPRIAQLIFEVESFTKMFDSLVVRMVHQS